MIEPKFLVSLLTTVHPLSDSLLVSKAQEYGFDLDKDEFMVALIETNHYQDDPLQALAMLEVIEEALKKEGGGLAFQFENQIVIIFSAHSHNQSQYDSLFRKQTYRKAEHLKTYLEKFSFDAVMGVGSLVHNPSAITLSYHQALTALNYSSCYPEQSLFFISDLENTPTEESVGKLQEMKSNILIAVKMGNEEQVTDGVNQLLGEHLASLGVQEMQALLLELSSSLQDLAHSYGHSLFAIGEEEGRNLFLELASLTTLGKARRWYTRLCLNLRAMNAGQRGNSHIQFIGQAKTLIAKHFTESGFGLEQICEMIGVSPSYFSSTFKREVGLSFVQYLTGMRMDRAKELLVKTEGKTYEIAQTVGFAEPNYFSFCFKRHVGLSPSQYRQAHR